MKRGLFLALTVLCLGGPVWADDVARVMDNATNGQWTMTVYNNSGSNLTSGYVVVWDTSSTSFTSSGYRYITNTTTVDDIWTAGVIRDDTCNASSLCTIVVLGPADVVCQDSSDAVGNNTYVGSSGTAGQCGDYTAAADKRALGTAMEAGNGVNGVRMKIFINTLGNGTG